MKLLNVLFIITLFALCTPKAYCEVDNETNYLKVDKIIWAKYEDAMQRISQELKQHPEKRDSLKIISQKIYEDANMENVAAAIKYAATPSGIQRLFMVRLDMPKEKLKSVLDTLPESTKGNPYYLSLLRHLNCQQLEPGNEYADLDLFDPKGNKVNLSNLINSKRTILVFDGLSCMGKEGRDELRSYVSQGENVIIFIQAESLMKLKEIVNTYPMNALFVSDFNGDRSEMKILYGTQAVPTVFIINKDAKIVYKGLGIHLEEIKTYLK